MKAIHYIWVVMLLVLASCGTVATTGSTDAASLRGEWKLQNDNANETGMSDEPVTISFDMETENSVGGFAGCNYYGGTYSDGTNGMLTFSAMHATKRACPDLNIENQFFELLNLVNRFEIKGNDLYLYQDSLLLLHFEK